MVIEAGGGMIARLMAPTGSRKRLYELLRGSISTVDGGSSIRRESRPHGKSLYDRSDKAGSCPRNRVRFTPTFAL
jgi:hypothetical protein